MENRLDIINALMSGLIDAEGDEVKIPRFVGEWLLDSLKALRVSASPVEQRENCQLFYCAHCGKSFWFPGVEDANVRRDFGYSVWYATCPICGEEIRLTDHYWR